MTNRSSGGFNILLNVTVRHKAVAVLSEELRLLKEVRDREHRVQVSGFTVTV